MPARPFRRDFSSRAIPYLASSATLALVMLTWSLADRAAHDRDESRLRTESQKAVESLQARIRQQDTLLRATAGFFAGSDEVTQKDFARFAKTLDLTETFPGIRGVGYALAMTPENEAKRTARARRMLGDKSWTPYPGGWRPFKAPAVFIQPETPQNRTANGFDMYSELTRREALSRARDEGTSILSARLTLRQSKRPGFVLYYPVYAHTSKDSEERRASILGYVYSPLFADEVLKSVFRNALGDDLALEIFDNTSPGTSNLVYRQGVADPSGLERVQQANIAGRTWTLRFRATPLFVAQSSSPLVKWVPLAGLVLTGLVFALVRGLGQAEEASREEALLTSRRAFENRLLADVSALLSHHADASVSLPAVAQRLIEDSASGAVILDEQGRRLATAGSEEGPTLSLPLVSGNESLGELRLSRHTPYNEEEKSLLQRVGGRIATTILASRFHHELQNELEERRRTEAAFLEEKRIADTLARITPVLALELDLRRLVQRVTDEATAVVRARFGAFFYNVNTGPLQELDLYVLSGARYQDFASFPKPRATSLFAPSFAGQVVRIGDVKQDSRYGGNAPYFGMPSGHLPVTSYLAVPVKDRIGAVTGVLLFGHEEADVFGAREESLAIGIAAAAGIALENANLFEEVRKLNADLEHGVKEREQDLDAFAYSMSHDLRTPLRAIMAHGRMLEEDFGDSLPEGAQPYIGRILAAGGRMDAFLSGLLLLGRIGRTEVHRERLDMTAMAEEAVPKNAEGIRFEIQRGMTAQGDRTLVAMLWKRLLENAVVFRQPDQSGTVRVGQEGHRFFVQDDGVGFDPSYVAKLFQPFERLHVDEGLGGHGLGSAVVRRIVERHEGAVSAEGEPGKGATFRFSLEPEAPSE